MSEIIFNIQNELFTLDGYGDEKAIVLDIHRKKYPQTRTESEVLQLMAAAFENAGEQMGREVTILVDDSDTYLMQDIEKLGGLAKGQVRLYEDQQKRAYVLRQAIEHDPTPDAESFFYATRLSERYFSKLTKLGSKVNARSKIPVPGKVHSVPEEDSFAKLTARRRSARGFSPNGFVAQATIHSILEKTFFVREDGHLPFPSVEGYNNISLYIANQEVCGGQFSLYEIDILTGEWLENLTAKPIDRELMNRAAFFQTPYENARFWIFMVADLTEMAKRFGPRALRFSLMSAGAALQQLHLTAAAYGCGARILGIYDDGILDGLLGVDNKNQVLVGVAAIGAQV